MTHTDADARRDTATEIRQEFIPAKVVISLDGLSVSPSRAELGWHIKPMTIFVRDDGWTLGAPRELEQVAQNQWTNRWVEMWERTRRGRFDETLTPWVLIWRRVPDA